MRLQDRVAIVTGGGHGIGRAFCFGLAKEGAKVVIADVDYDAAMGVAEGIWEWEKEALPVKTDVSDQSSTIEMVNRVLEQFGRIDILINNAAYMIELGFEKAWDEIEVAEWDKVMAVNLRGMFLCSRAVVPYMKAQGKGKIINISSNGAFWGMPGRIHYATSKAGVLGFTMTLARALAGCNINVNAIAPGFTLSERVIAGDYMTSERLEQVSDHSMQCIQEDMHPKDLLGTAVFLASDESDFICGQTIVVDGGFITR